jgi:hypothetical protein
MGEVLGLGITHYPALTRQTPTAVSLRLLLKDPGLPAKYKNPANWPKVMQEEWGADEGASFARKHCEDVVDELRRARAALDEFKPDFVLVWGDDQYENFHEDLIPGFCVMAYDSVDAQPWAKPNSPPNAWGENPDTVFQVKGHRAAGKYIATRLIEQSFDIAYAYKPLHVQLGHAFLNTVLFLDWDRRGFDYPIVPFAVNCYGRRVIAARGYMESLENPIKESDFDPPSPSPARCFDLGAACARALKESPWRVALVASSSWSHAFMTRKHSFLYPDTEADQKLFEALRDCNWDAWRSVTLKQIEESGQHELLNWFCLVGAMSALNRKPNYASFIETNIMNSNKVTAVFSPGPMA